MSTRLFFLLASIFTIVSGNDQFWVTSVLTEFKVRDQCAAFWNQSQACSNPSLRISTNINQPTQFASRAWQIQEILNSTGNPTFISQWHGSIDSIRVSVQVEGSNPLNPFGLVAKCDEGFHPKVVFNQSSIDVMERLSTRVVVINSQCFTAKVLLKVDTECPYCPPPTTTPQPTTLAPESFIYTHRLPLIAIILLIIFTILSFCLFYFVLRRFMTLRRGFKTCPSLESGISTITPLSYSTVISPEKKQKEFVDFFALMPPVIEYEELDLDASIDIESMPRLGSLVYDYFCYENQVDVSVSDAVYV
ncbi:hypothetical protein GCK72_010589 [Caenorhabditis remanei]|uniref:C2 domain-containing protein n=1 Tax=Caenorhabditis remanei TaxID=31234 RepID=A0A6A5H553_CAERE|nr:hypothetical protein GCK72_010589 [Caenorhabditis remanei]KAF1762327.1 hypothetical protein GCK72_010589 [Caenorhabditis remanei]